MVAAALVMDGRLETVEVDGARGSAREGGVEEIAAELRERIGEEKYDLWFGNKTRLTLAGNMLVVTVPNAFVGRWVGQKFRDDLVEASRVVVGRMIEVSVRVEEGAMEQPVVRAISPVSRPMAVRVMPANVAPINPKYTLEEFVIGPSNQMAYQASVRVAEKPGVEFNPLFLHGHCGMGKTHLLQGICQRFARVHPGKKWLYMTGEQFTNEFLEAIKAHKTDAFRRRIRNADLLVIDDVHFLGNKKATQEEFLHTFNQVDAGGKQIVLASDCAPRQIQALSEQLSSRFVSGMVLRIDSPDVPTRLEILRRKAARNGWNVNDAVLMHIAQSSTSSVRELEGLLLQVMAGMSLIEQGAPAAGTVLASIRERTAMRGPVAVERIVEAVAEHFGIMAAALLGSSREKLLSLARAVAMYLARKHTGKSFPEIAREMGNKNHSTVIAACQRIEGLISGGELLCWMTPAGPKHQSVPDALHELEAVIRRVG